MNVPKMFAASFAAGIFTSGAAQNRSGPPTMQPLTAAELAKVKTVLAPYKPASLTAGDAKTIKRSLRDAGLRRSRELDAALVTAGFSPDKLDLLDPPPPPPPPLPSVKK